MSWLNSIADWAEALRRQKNEVRKEEWNKCRPNMYASSEDFRCHRARISDSDLDALCNLVVNRLPYDAFVEDAWNRGSSLQNKVSTDPSIRNSAATNPKSTYRRSVFTPRVSNASERRRPPIGSRPLAGLAQNSTDTGCWLFHSGSLNFFSVFPKFSLI